jgi:hypothetical protein
MSLAPAEIFLEYRRVGETSSGELYTKLGDRELDRSAFEELPFDKMLYELARRIALHPDARVLFVRSDRLRAMPYELDQCTVDLLRADPVAAVRALSYPGSPSTLVLRSRQERVPMVPVLRTGFNLLAETFGPRVYARRLNGDAECPGCGYWSPLGGHVFRCTKRCQIEIPVVVEGNWLGVDVTDLLATSLPHFYLPRAWNPRPVIQRHELERLYKDFISEKEKVTCSMTATT